MEGTTGKHEPRVTMLRLVRSSRGLSQTELARRAHVSRRQLNLIENSRSKPTAPTMNRIAAELGVSIAVLFGEQPADLVDAQRTLREARRRSGKQAT
jgi:transcriptional regulator with XRE-family HTH domain